MSPAAVDMNTLQFMHGRPHPQPSGRLTAADRTLRQLRPGSVAAFRELAAPATGPGAPDRPEEPQ